MATNSFSAMGLRAFTYPSYKLQPTYTPVDGSEKATLPDGSFLEYTYDAAHRLTEINDAEGNRIVYTLDAMGNRTAEDVFDRRMAISDEVVALGFFQK